MADLDDPRLGSIVQDRYRVLERIASGGMGVVYRAERVELGRTVAMKFLHPVFASEPSFHERFDREAKLMSRLDHPHCVSVIDFGVADGPYIVMEYVTGQTLGDVLDDAEPLPADRAIRIARQVLAGLSHAHEQGIVHRDIKPANLMLAKATGTGDHARILDFGLAKLRGIDQSTASTIVGTPSYMSPEQASIAPVDGRTDVYSTALVLYELLTGERAFYADEPFEVIRMHREVPPPRLADAREGLRFSEELEAAMATALAKRPEDRHQSPAAFRDALAATPEAAGQVVAAPAPRSARSDTVDVAPLAPPSAIGRTRSRRGAGRRLLMVGALAAAGGAAWQLGWLSEVTDTLGERRSQAISALEKLRGTTSEAAAAPSQAAATFEDAEALSAAGNREQAIGLLHQLRREHPGDARAPYLLGQLYIEKGWRSEALAAYAEALDRDPSYSDRPALIGHAVDALADDATRNKARALLLRRIEKAAVPALRRAARDAERPVVAREARRLLGELDARPRR